MREDVVTTKGLTVEESQAKEFMELVEGGEDPKVAAKGVGTTLAKLKKSGVLARVCRELMETVAAEKLIEKKTREGLARARLLQLMMQDTDLKVALGAAKAQLDDGGAKVQIGIQTNLLTDPAVVESLKSLQLEVEGEKEN